MKNIAQLEHGDVLCDMHNGLKNLRIAGQYEITNHIRIECQCGSDFISKHLKQATNADYPPLYTNKLLVVIGFDYPNRTIQAAYSYDAHTLGIVTIATASDTR